MINTDKINMKTAVQSLQEYFSGSTFLLYCAILSSFWNSFSAKMQFISNWCCSALRVLFARHLPQIHMFRVESANRFFYSMRVLPIWSIWDTFFASSAFAELNRC